MGGSTMTSTSKATHSATIMSVREFESIRESILPPKEDNYKEIRRQELKKMSQDRLKHWPNTLEALRLKKERFAIEREEEAERKRQEIDKEEAELRRIQRLEAIRYI